jgi:hypothetical protein
MCVEETEKLRMVLTVGKELARKKLRKAYRGGGVATGRTIRWPRLPC